MRVLGSGETSREEMEKLMFDAEDDLGVALNKAFIKLTEFAYIVTSDQRPPAGDVAMRAELQRALNEIVRLADRPRS